MTARTFHPAPTAEELTAESGRSYHVRYHRDFRGTGIDWRVHFYGHGHWCRSDGQHHGYQTKALAEAAGRAWVATGRTDGEVETAPDRGALIAGYVARARANDAAAVELAKGLAS